MNDGRYVCSQCKRVVDSKVEGFCRAVIETGPSVIWRTHKLGDLICKECWKETEGVHQRNMDPLGSAFGRASFNLVRTSKECVEGGRG